MQENQNHVNEEKDIKDMNLEELEAYKATRDNIAAINENPREIPEGAPDEETPHEVVGRAEEIDRTGDPAQDEDIKNNELEPN